MNIRNIGKTIAEKRKKLNMSQKDLADKLNVSNKTISKWECGNGIPDIESLDKLASAFDITLDELLNPPSETLQVESADNSTESTPIATTKNKHRKLLLSLIIAFSLVFVLATSLLCYFFIPRKPEIISTDKFYVDKENSIVSCTVDNAIEQFSFSDSIEVPITNKWNVYYDLNGIHAINSQTVNLQTGDNTFYIVVENSAGNKKTYQVIIRRKPLYVVTFNTNGGETIVNEIVMEDDFATYQEPVREGYIFNSWDFDFAQPITSNITINAMWIAKNITVTYYANNGTENILTQDITYDDEISFKNGNEFSKEGYTLSGWNTKADGSGTAYSVGQTFNNFQVSENDFNLYAQWTVNQYTITTTKNLQNAGSINGIGSFDYGTVQTLTALTNIGYAWDGWYSKENILISKSQTLTVTIGCEGQEYIAKWTANKYNIALDVNGGNTISQSLKELIFGENFVLPVPTRTEAVFLGWFDINNNKYTNNEGVSVKNWDIANATTLYAHYKINEYQVSLSENIDVGGSLEGFGLKEYDSKVTIIAQPNTGYSFVGWYNGTTLISSLTEYSFIMQNTPISFTAKWKANTYTVTMDVNGGINLLDNTQDVIYDNSFSLPTTNKEGYLFDGWYLGVNGTGRQITDDFGNSITTWDIPNNITLYAKWNVVNYSINYILNGGTNYSTNPATYNVEDSDITLNYPTKNGYTFNGWVATGANNAEKNTIIPSGSIGEKTFAASWVKSSSFIAISTAQELQAIQNNPSGYYYLTKDIDLSSFDWSPISEFNGILDGNGYSIIGLTFNSNDIVLMSNWKQLALILNNRGKIENLNIQNATISLGGGGSAYFAVLTVFNYGTIHNCSISANINTHGGNWGTIAYNNDITGLISNCCSSGILDGDEATAGGIVGYNEGIIKNCHSDMILKAIANTAQKDILAGICATNGSSISGTHATIENCFFTGKIENGYYQYGITYNYGTQGAIKNCFVDATIGNPRDTTFGDSYTIANVADSLSITNCYYSDSMNTPSKIEKTGIETNSESFNDKQWLKTNLGYYEFISELDLWLDDSNIWVFEDGKLPKLYWETN